MQSFLDAMLALVQKINSYLADYILIFLLIGVGLFFTIRTKFVQVRYFGEGMKNVFGKIKLNGKKEKSGMSSFQALATAIAAQVGTGNIVGASGAILAGGPGAIFWMWIIAFLGMSTIYAEAVLAQKTRVVNEDGSISGGPVYYIKEAFKNNFGKILAVLFSIFIIIALGFIGCMVQSNAIGGAVKDAFSIPTWVTGLIVASICFVVFIGGVSRIASVTEKIVPIMACLYLLGGLIIICAKITAVPEAFGLIFKYAFTPNAIIGGSIGAALKIALSQGAKRGLFSNEAGMGSTPHAHAQANVKDPHTQGTCAMIGVFIDTFIVLTMTALIVIVTLYAGNGQITQISNQAMKDGVSISKCLESANITENNLVATGISSVFASNSVMAKIGFIFVAICLTFFAFSTIISWNLFGKINFEYLFGKKYIFIYSIIGVVFTFLGAILYSGLVWGLTDFFNYLMVIPNVLALIGLSSVVIKEVNEHKKQKNKNKQLNDK